MKKLIKLHPVTKSYLEVDKVKLERLSLNLLNFIKNNISPLNDPHEIWKWVVPLCEGVLNNTLATPIPYNDLPLKHAIREGLLADNFEELYAPFANTITGTVTKITADVEINGELFTYVDFE